MERLIAIATAAIFCISAGIEFIFPKADTFAFNTETDSFYWSPDKKSLDSATLYRLQNGVDRTIDACKTDQWVVGRNAGDGWGTASPYWFAVTADGKEVSMRSDTPADGNTTPLHFHSAKTETATNTLYTSTVYTADVAEGGEYYICAPAYGEITSSHYDCDGGHTFSFTYEGDDKQLISMSITDAKCWYCCRDKNPDSARSGCDVVNGNVIYKANTPTSLKGNSMGAGCCLVVATPKTQITFSIVS